MPIFKYRARDSNGRLIQDRMEAEGEKAVVIRLQKEGLYPIDIKQAQEPIKIRPLHRIQTKDLYIFTRNLANLISSGVPLVHGLDLLGKGAKKREFQRVLVDIKRSVEDGKSLNEAISLHSGIFPLFYVGMVKAGETSGALQKVLYRLSSWLEREEKIKSAVYSAMIYPAIMLIVAGGAIIFLMGFVIPKFESMFMDIGESLPLPTRILINLGLMLSQGWWIILSILLVVILLVSQYLKTEKGRFDLDHLLLGIPFLGEILRKLSIARFSRALQILIDSGIPLLRGLEIVRDMEGNQVIKRWGEDLCHLVKGGEGLASSMEASNLFSSPFEADMIRVGESSGDLAGSLSRISDIYEEEIDRSLKTFVSLLEPLIILFMGVVVGFIVLAMLLPIFRMGTLIR